MIIMKVTKKLFCIFLSRKEITKLNITIMNSTYQLKLYCAIENKHTCVFRDLSQLQNKIMVFSELQSYFLDFVTEGISSRKEFLP